MIKVKELLGGDLDRLANYLNKHPIFGGVGFIVAYFLFDNEFMINTSSGEPMDYVVMFSMVVSYFAYYISYLRNKLKEDISDKDRNIEIGFFISLIVITQIIFFSYDTLITEHIPSISKLYYKSEVIVLLILAPILEELAFRYLLYDKWARPHYGKVIGGLLIGLIFIVTHPINSFIGFTVYWLPTLFLFMTYDLGGIKASIAAHMLFNLVAILSTTHT